MRHVIQQQHLHVEFDGPESEAMPLQRRLRRLCNDHLMPVMEEALNSQVQDGEHIYLEKVEIDVGKVSVENVEVDLPHSLRGELFKALREELLSPRASSRRRNPPQATTEAFLFFLEHGTLPWWFQLPAGKDLEQALLDCWQEAAGSDGFSQTHLDDARVLLTREHARRRLILQFSETFLSLFLPMLSAQVALRVAAIRKKLDNLALPRELLCLMMESLWKLAFAAAHRSTATERELVSLAWRELPSHVREQPEFVATMESRWPGLSPEGRKGPRLQPLEAKPGEEAPPGPDRRESSGEVRRRGEPKTAKEGIYIDNGGMVLLHPYLPRLFERLNFSEGPRLLLPERAVAALHYLASGSLEQPEFRVTLPKLLCDIPIRTPISKKLRLTEREREECDELLCAVIEHWGALGNSSPDGLRGSFLMRQAKLSQREDDEWLLQVESNSCDILLEQLPWSISMVKLPWMPKLLWVQWN